MNESYKDQYHQKIARAFLAGLFLHLPVFALQAWYFKTEYLIALGLSTLVLMGPLISYMFTKGSVITLNLIGFSMMCFSGIMIHLGKGMIEMHFHVFASLAILSVMGSMTAIVTAVLTIAIHHLGFWYLLPTSVFNYQASLGIVLLHAAYVIAEAIPTLFITSKFKLFIDVQGSVLTQLSNVSDACVMSSDKLKRTSTSLEQCSQEQSISVSSSGEALSRISKVMGLNNEQIQKAQASARNGLELGEISQSSVSNMASSMETLNSSMQYLEELVTIVNSIKSKSKMIKDVAFKTQLLSFNASIEAARAGEHGKAFSVVAEEVVNLAQNSGLAAAEIDILIKDSDIRTQKIVETLRDVVTKGVGHSHDLVSKFSCIKEQLHSITESMEKATISCLQQEKDVKEVVRQVEQVSAISRQNDLNATEVSHLAKNIHQQGRELTVILSGLKSAMGEKKSAIVAFRSPAIYVKGKAA